MSVHDMLVGFKKFQATSIVHKYILISQINILAMDIDFFMRGITG